MMDGVNLANLNDVELVEHRRERVGIVFQFFNLVPTLTAKENVELPMRLAGKDSKTMRTRSDELIGIVGMTERAKHKPDELSGGEQQRVGLATALANNPPVILADEPTGELDSETGKHILRLFQELRDKHGKTIIIVTHDQRIGEIADRVMTMVDGRITGEITGKEFQERRVNSLTQSVQQGS